MVYHLNYRLGTESEDTEFDGGEIMTVFDRNLSKSKQKMQMITDGPISTIFKFLARQDPTSFESLSIAETEYFQSWRPDGNEGQQKMQLTGSLVFLPSSIILDHWSLIIYSVPENELYLIDSAVKLNEGSLTQVRRLVRGFSHFYEVAGIEEAPLKVARCSTWQGSTNNCGAWVTYFCQQIIRGEVFNENADMHQFRQEMVEYLRMDAGA